MMNFNAQINVINENHSTIGKSISILWGHSELVDYLHLLMIEYRVNNKQKLPSDVIEAIQILAVQHDSEFPRFKKHF